MATLACKGGELVVELSPLEKVGAFRGDVRIPISSIRTVRVSHDSWSEIRGVRAPGTGIPGKIALSTRRGGGVKDFTAVYGKKPAVVVEAVGGPFDRLVVSSDDPDTAAAMIQQALPGRGVAG